MSFKPISVSQLNTYVKQIFDAEELLHGICVVGEISGWSNVRGTAYFTLKDASSALSCVCFTADKYSSFVNGDSVMVIGSVTYYTKSGKLNFNVSKIEAYGESVLYKQFLELKEELNKKGYFDISRKKPKPNIPLWRGNELAYDFLRVCISIFDAPELHRLYPSHSQMKSF